MSSMVTSPFGGCLTPCRLAGQPAVPESYEVTLGAQVLRQRLPTKPDVVLAVIPRDARAARLGLSRTHYLRGRLDQETVTPLHPVTTLA